MNAVRRADGAFNADGLVQLVQAVSERSISREGLLHLARAHRLGNAVRADNSIALLIELEVLASEGGRLTLNALPKEDQDWKQVLRDAVLRRYCAMLLSTDLGSAFQLGDEAAELRLDAMQLPHRDLGYPPLLLQFGIARRRDALDRAWVVSEDCVDAFMQVLSAANLQPAKRRFSLDALLALKERQADAGRRAEAFALEFEKQRLDGHRFIDQIRLIGEDDTGAGYDLLSFDRRRSLVHDRMIEVKGFGDEKAFYWSDGEMAAARRLRDRYWLYLVDRTSMSLPGYEPEMVQDPFAYFIEENPEGWVLEPTAFKLIAPSTPPHGASLEHPDLA